MLYLTGKLEAEAKVKQEEHREVSSREGLILDFVDKQVPADWAKWPIERRRDFWAGQHHTQEGHKVELVDRDRVCAAEVWCELFNSNIRDMKTPDTREINGILSRMTGWKRQNGPKRFGPYNLQRGFFKE